MVPFVLQADASILDLTGEVDYIPTPGATRMTQNSSESDRFHTSFNLQDMDDIPAKVC